MKKFLVSAAAAALVLAPSFAFAKKEVQVTRTVYELTDFPDLAKKAEAVCGNDSLKKSVRLSKACSDKQFPRVTKAGMFYNTGYGAELNALIRQ